jgi:Recombination endonuclease VII
MPTKRRPRTPKPFCNNGHPRTPDNLTKKGHCLVCAKAYHKKYNRDHPNKRTEYGRKWRFGITQEEFDAKLKEQNNRCAICGHVFLEGDKICQDHNHSTKENRGLLCNHCNTGLGSFKENPTSLIKAAEYLTQYLQ